MRIPRPNTKGASAPKISGEDLAYRLLLAFLLVVVAFGGASRSDEVALLVLRPASIVACTAGLLLFRQEAARPFRVPFAFLLAIVGIVLLQLIPLPPAMWQALPERDIIVRIGEVAGQANKWRPLSMVPDNTWNALFSLATPLGIALLAMRAGRDRVYRLLPWVIGIGLTGAVVGMAQVLGPADGPLYFYRIHNSGSATGLFSNRNHHALFLATLFPMLAAYVSTRPRNRHERFAVADWAAMTIGIALVPLLLVAGSRAGLIAALLGIAAIPLIYRRPDKASPMRRHPLKLDPRLIAGSIAVFVIAGLTVLTSRAESLTRLLRPDEFSDQRSTTWGQIASEALKQFPFGSGAGTFDEHYRLIERDDQLSGAYLNHAHNDWLEWVLNLGLPGLILIGFAILWWAAQTRSAWNMRNSRKRGEIFAMTGCAVLLLMFAGSAVDYPLRTPVMMTMCVVAVMWIRYGSSERGKNR